MQTGTVTRHGRGWRGYWREDGKRHATATHAKKGEARADLNRQLERIALGAAYRAPVTFRELVDRFTAQHDVQPQTLTGINKRLKGPLAAWGDAQARDVTGEAIGRLLRSTGTQASYRASVLATLRMVFSFGQRARLVDGNPAKEVRQRAPHVSEKIIPFESWAEVEAVAAEAGRWAPLIVFAADCGARPGELRALEHRHVDVAGGRIYLPGSKTENASRVVHLTARGIQAYRSFPRSISTPLVWWGARGAPLSWPNWRWDVWYPAVELAGLKKRPPYSLRHTFAVWSLRAGVPIQDLAREMGHSDVSITFRTYGRWADEMGSRAATLRETWAAGTNVAPRSEESP